MTWELWTLAAIVYLAGAVLMYGAELAFTQREFALIAERALKGDRVIALISGLIWPVTFWIGLFLSKGYKHGLLYR